MDSLGGLITRQEKTRGKVRVKLALDEPIANLGLWGQAGIFQDEEAKTKTKTEL